MTRPDTLWGCALLGYALGMWGMYRIVRMFPRNQTASPDSPPLSPLLKEDIAAAVFFAFLFASITPVPYLFESRPGVQTWLMYWALGEALYPRWPIKDAITQLSLVATYGSCYGALTTAWLLLVLKGLRAYRQRPSANTVGSAQSPAPTPELAPKTVMVFEHASTRTLPPRLHSGIGQKKPSHWKGALILLGLASVTLIGYSEWQRYTSLEYRLQQEIDRLNQEALQRNHGDYQLESLQIDGNMLVMTLQSTRYTTEELAGQRNAFIDSTMGYHIKHAFCRNAIIAEAFNEGLMLEFRIRDINGTEVIHFISKEMNCPDQTR
ncbi:MAG: hypothetical protein EP312_02040 [Gammaproteobacteria bacterium]|nr:MAG: hypothetical protein EP312_02040 [Gammaproteobacteria bacterium]